MRYVLRLLLAACAVWCLGLVWFIGCIPMQPSSDQENTDAIVVLTGGSLRLERGFQLLAEGRAPKMFVSGVEDGLTLPALLRKKEYRDFADHIPAGSVTLGYKARSTLGNAEETAAWMAAGQVRTIRLVTGSYHMPRSMYELHEAAPDVRILPEPVFPGHFEHNAWWQWADSIRLVMSEYHKYLATLLAHTLIPKS